MGSTIIVVAVLYKIGYVFVVSKLKIAPSSKESEMMVLGCMLTSINSLNAGSDYLFEGDFYFPEHRVIFEVLRDAYRNDRPADVHLVCEELNPVTLASSGPKVR